MRSPVIFRETKLSLTKTKAKALNTWEQDARQLMAASNEGMPGSNEGAQSEDHHRFGEVVRAKTKIGKKPKHKQSH
jgi:hypothetical protein